MKFLKSILLMVGSVVSLLTANQYWKKEAEKSRERYFEDLDKVQKETKCTCDCECECCKKNK